MFCITVHIPVSPSVLRAYRRRLTNLSSRNRSLVLSSLPATQCLDLHDADFVLSKPSFSLIEGLLERRTSIPLCAVLDARQERSNELSRKLRRIDRTARFITDERGTEDLFVGWPFVRGKFLDGSVVHAPLLFFPVAIDQQGKNWRLTRRGDVLGFLNPTFLIAYSQFNQVRLPDELAEKTLAEFDRDPLVFRTQLYEWLKSSLLELNFNTDLFTDTLQFFDRQTLRSLDQLERTGELKLMPEAVLGIFPQAGSYLVPDYDRLLALATDTDDADSHLHRDEPAQTDNLAWLPEKLLRTPLPLDAPQEAAIRAVRAGQSLVVQGPPGTGKSQLIANLMADAAAAGKRVLLICQKRAALDVVFQRLDAVGMGAFLALIHDFQNDRQALYQQLAGQIDRLDAYRQLNNGLDAVLLERDFDQESQRIDEAVQFLDAFRTALFDSSRFGVSPKELYLTSSPHQPILPLPALADWFDGTSATSFEEQLTALGAYRQRLGPNHPWAVRRSFQGYSLADRASIDQTITQWRQQAVGAQQQGQALGLRPLLLADLQQWHAAAWSLTALQTLLDRPDAEQLWPALRRLLADRTHPAHRADESILLRQATDWANAQTEPFPNQVLAPIDRPPFRLLLTEAQKARASWAAWQWWRLTSNGVAQLDRVLLGNGLTASEADLQVLATRLDKALLADALTRDTAVLFEHLPIRPSPDGLRQLVYLTQVRDRIDDLPVLAQLPDDTWQTCSRFRQTIQTLVVMATEVVDVYTAQPYLTDAQLTELWTDEALAQRLRQALRTDFDLLVEADRILGGFTPEQQAVVDSLETSLPDQWATLFINTVRLAWLTQLEAESPILRSVSSLRMEQTERQLQQSLQRKQQLSRDILLVRLREQTYRRLTYNRLGNLSSYRDLQHQVTKKRSVWPVRKLMDAFADDVFKLVPCWLASPESVSAMFPLREGLFDLVIFDEASQCFAESGLPAFHRARQLVITGDSQQLRPSDLYRTHVDDQLSADEEPAPELDVESLLELAAQHLPQRWLTEHYRSRSLDLITFSNQLFYQNKLQLLPDFATVNSHEPAITYQRVEGLWEQQTNPIEAEAVCRLLDQLAVEKPGRSVGVVTFNYPQQQLIQNLLDETPLGQTIPNLFVKNIENVQGDERDIIVFSVGYAPDARGRLAMQFGSLTMTGGENRLNVAVTRAREHIYVITSLWPDQLTVDTVSGQGPRRLRDYLAYARQVSDGQFRAQPPVQSQSQYQLSRQLSGVHPDWRPELPFADLTVRQQNVYHSLVLTDDEQYHRQPAKQSHAYLPLALYQRHWPFQRVWSRQFWQDTPE